MEIQHKLATLALLLALSASAIAQGTKTPTDDKKFIFAKIATNVIANTEHKSLAGYFVIVVDEKNWASLLNDGDLGPFLKQKEQKVETRAVILTSNPKELPSFCVYFEGITPVGLSTVRPNPAGKIERAEVASAYKTVPGEALKEGDEELYFIPGQVTSDDDQPVPGYKIAGAGKRPPKK
jgi:hypothetical protein